MMAIKVVMANGDVVEGEPTQVAEYRRALNGLATAATPKPKPAVANVVQVQPRFSRHKSSDLPKPKDVAAIVNSQPNELFTAKAVAIHYGLDTRTVRSRLEAACEQGLIFRYEDNGANVYYASGEYVPESVDFVAEPLSTGMETEIYNYLQTNRRRNGLNYREIAEATKFKPGSVSACLSVITRKGYAERIGKGRYNAIEPAE